MQMMGKHILIYDNVLLFGTDAMAEEYLKVLKALSCSVNVVGRNSEKAAALARRYGYEGFGGGVSALDGRDLKGVRLVIVACAVEALEEVAGACLTKGVYKVLVEKPGALTLKGLNSLRALVGSTRLRIAYNRRYYNSVRMLRDAISHDGGALGCVFDFTDREKDILGSHKAPEVVARWGWVNSTHVIDTAFYLIGLPDEIDCRRKGGWVVHPSGNVFVGSGESVSGVPFSYFSTWAGGGRWNIEISTSRGRYRLSPMEELAFCVKNQFSWQAILPPDDDDARFKPGVFKIVKSFLENGDVDDLPDIKESVELGKVVERIFGYGV